MRVAVFSATDNEIGAIERGYTRASDSAEIDLEVRSKRDLKDEDEREGFLEFCLDSDFVLLNLHGPEDSMPGYEEFIDELDDEDKPVCVKSTGDPFALRDTTVDDEVRDRIYDYIDKGGIVNLENLLLYLADRYGTEDAGHDDPVELPTEGIYHPDYPGIEYEDYLETLDDSKPTVGVWFYESQWVHGNTDYIDAVVREIESNGANALPVFLTPTYDEEIDNRPARWVARNWFTRDGESVVDAVVSSLMFSLSMEERGRSGNADEAGDTNAFLEELGVPVIQTVTTMRSRSRYESADQGLMSFELSLSVALPEYDGNLITFPVSGKESVDPSVEMGTSPKRHKPIDHRVERAVSLAVNWARLSYIPNSEKKVAVVLHNYPPTDHGIGTAFGLDSPESAVRLLEGLDERGYETDVPESGEELLDVLTSQLTLDNRWVAPEDVEEIALDTVSEEEYLDWFEDAPEGIREGLVDEWGEPEGEGDYPIPGTKLGNVLVTVQPPRGFGDDPSKIYHSSDLNPPHDYYAFYEWIRHEFEADAVVHLGTHGSLEWLPGKTVGLSESCFPDAMVQDIPNVYPYIVNNPGEGAQAKRRSYAALVDYLTPVMKNAGLYDELAEIEDLCNEYKKSEADKDEAGHLRDLIWERIDESGVDEDIDISREDDFDDVLTRLHSYLNDVKKTQIRSGLHTMGQPPHGEDLVEYLVALTRLGNPGAPSLRKSVTDAMGYDYDEMLDSPSEYVDELGMTWAEATDEVDETCVSLVSELAEEGFDVSGEYVREITRSYLGDSHEDVEEVLSYIADEIKPSLDGAENEISRTADALNGEYVPPGKSGAPTRGNADVLPTARNFYTIDPRTVPSKAAYRVGSEVAESTLKRHLDENGEYPEEMGVVAWGTPIIRSNGETIAEVLRLMGVRPEWSDSGRVEGVEPIPLEDLDRPRIDVTTRVSGLFRDAFPPVAKLLNEAVETVVELDEPHDMNYVKKHVEDEADELIEDGLDEDEALDTASYRVFCTKPGGYGAGTNKAVDESEWEDASDLAEIYVEWGGYALTGRDVVESKDVFETRLGNVEATLKTEDTQEQDEFDSSDWYAFHGGFITAVETVSGEKPESYVGDTSDPDRIEVYTNDEKVKKALRARVLNPKWIDSMKEHGYKGAGDLAQTVDTAFGWDATTDVIDDAAYEEIAEKYAFDEDTQDWMRDVNPWALESITERLLEAIQRGMWDADDETEDDLRRVYLSVEGEIEEETEASIDAHRESDSSTETARTKTETDD
ncbi:cobaltochelatase subunit CobN [Halorutilales archaeon Cl-col2-1]